LLPGQVDRITGTVPSSTVELEITNATSNTLRPAPTIAYHIQNAILIDIGALGDTPSRERWACFILSQRPFLLSLAVDDCRRYGRSASEGLFMPTTRRQTYFEQDWTPIDGAWIDHFIVYQASYRGAPQNSLRKGLIRTLREEHEYIFRPAAADYFFISGAGRPVRPFKGRTTG
jgi:hypothetical protein